MKSRYVKPTLALLLVLGVSFVIAVGLASAAAHVLDWRVIGSGDVGGSCLIALATTCDLTSDGTADATHGTHVGDSTYHFAVTAGTGDAVNAEAGVCLPANNTADQGPGTVTAANGDVINFNTVGWLCEEGAPNSPLQYNGTYRIIGGTGRFTDAVGGGNLAATFERDADGVAFIKLDGVLNNTSAKLKALSSPKR